LQLSLVPLGICQQELKIASCCDHTLVRQERAFVCARYYIGAAIDFEDIDTALAAIYGIGNHHRREQNNYSDIDHFRNLPICYSSAAQMSRAWRLANLH